MFRCMGFFLVVIVFSLQVAVSLQPILPKKFHIAPVCMSITHNLLSPAQHERFHTTYQELVQPFLIESHHDHNDQNHQCQYCTVYGDVVLPFEFGVDEVLDRIQVQLAFLRQSYWHVYFSLQKLYLLPQGRAPPITL